jgi:hypothetical protein
MKTQEKSKDTPKFTGKVTEVETLDVVSDFSKDGQAGSVCDHTHGIHPNSD